MRSYLFNGLMKDIKNQIKMGYLKIQGNFLENAAEEDFISIHHHKINLINC